MTFDETAYERWIETAREDLRVAEHNSDGAFHHAAVLYAEQAAQCALKALLHAVGRGDLARGHGLLSLIEACEEEAGLGVPSTDREAIRDLALNYQTTRYPDALAEGTPRDHFGPGSAERAIATARTTIESVEDACAGLQTAAGDRDAGEVDDGGERS